MRARVEKVQGVGIVAREIPRPAGLHLNSKRPSFNDARVRKAVQAAIDVRAIIAGICEGCARPAIGPFAIRHVDLRIYGGRG